MSDHDPTYWAKLSRLVREMGRATPVFVDGGANEGEFTARLLAEFADGYVHAVEPNPALARRLEARFQGQRVRVWNAALHEREGTLQLQVHENTGTSSLLPRPQSGRRYYHSADRVVATVPVEAITLDRLAREAGIETIALLKLDTQGAELPILRGARGLLARCAADILYTEFFVVPHYEGAATLHELWAELAGHGYVLHDLFKGPYGRNGQWRFGDAIFVSPALRTRLLDAYPEEP